LFYIQWVFQPFWIDFNVNKSINKEGTIGDWIKQHEKELHDMYSSPISIWVIKLRRMRWQTCNMHGREKVHTGFCGET
jgi:hypothetical protein